MKEIILHYFFKIDYKIHLWQAGEEGKNKKTNHGAFWRKKMPKKISGGRERKKAE